MLKIKHFRLKLIKSSFMVWMYSLIVVGLLFLFFEIFFVPGTTIVGLVGLAIAGFGIYQLYTEHSVIAGTIGLVVTAFGFLGLLIVGFRQRSWEQYAINEALKGRTNVIEENEVKVGDKGKALSAIKPIGKARLNDANYEVQAYSEYIDEGEAITVSKIKGKTIYVQRKYAGST